MFEIKKWVQVLKALKVSDKQKEELLKKNLNLFENLLYKISKIKQDFDEKTDLSEFEIEAYSRLIANITKRLVESWEDIVIAAIESLQIHLEQLMLIQSSCLKKVKTTLKCCRVILKECKDCGKLKSCYRNPRIEKNLSRLEEFQEFVSDRYLSVI